MKNKSDRESGQDFEKELLYNDKIHYRFSVGRRCDKYDNNLTYKIGGLY